MAAVSAMPFAEARDEALHRRGTACAAFPRSGGALSGAQTTLLILRRPQRLDPGFVDYRYQPMHPTGAVLLGCLISLPPAPPRSRSTSNATRCGCTCSTPVTSKPR